MIIGIHQPHFFSWMGYFDKIARSDIFVLMDNVQMEKGSNMYRAKVLNNNGGTSYLTIACDKQGMLNKVYNQINVSNEIKWKERQMNALKSYYFRSPYFSEVWKEMSTVYSATFSTVNEYAILSINIIKKLLNIDTPIKFLSEIEMEFDKKKNDLVLEICEKMNADIYLSGNGAKKYMDTLPFEKKGIKVIYQKFQPVEYRHYSNANFIPGLSILDMLFSIGIDDTRSLFWHQFNTCKYA